MGGFTSGIITDVDDCTTSERSNSPAAIRIVRRTDYWLASPLRPAYRHTVNIVALQLDIVWENKESNFEKVRRLLVQSAPEKDSLVVLPEMFATGFSMNTVAEPAGERTEPFLTALAREFHVCVVAGAAVLGPDGRARNQVLAISPEGGTLARYSKMRPFVPGGEAERYLAGHAPVVFDWLGWKVSPFVCYDLRFPEIFRIATATHRPHLFVVIANWPQRRIHHWVRLLQARAIENQAWVVGVNRCGRDPDHVYNGRSLVVDPHGEIAADAGEGEGSVTGCLDFASLKAYRSELPFLADMRSVRIECAP
jgi:omega-amidase